MSWAKAALRSSSIMALPPYLTTTTAPAEALEPGQRLDEGLRLGRGGGQGGLVAPVAKAGHVQYAEFSWT